MLDQNAFETVHTAFRDRQAVIKMSVDVYEDNFETEEDELSEIHQTSSGNSSQNDSINQSSEEMIDSADQDMVETEVTFNESISSLEERQKQIKEIDQAMKVKLLELKKLMMSSGYKESAMVAEQMLLETQAKPKPIPKFQVGIKTLIPRMLR